MAEPINDFDKSIVTSDAPQSRLSGADVAQPAQELAKGTAQLAGGLSDLSVPLAERAAAQDLGNQKVTRDAGGNVQVLTPTNSVMFGETGKAYEHSIAAGTVAAAGNAVSQDMTEMAQKHLNDPEGFKAASDAHIQKLPSTVDNPVIAQMMVRQARQLQTEHYDNIVNQTAKLDVINSGRNLQGQIDIAKDTLMGLAHQGVTSGPQWDQAAAKFNGGWDALGANPLYKMPPEQVAYQKNTSMEMLKKEGFVSHIDEIYNKSGKAEAQKQLEALKSDPNLKTTDADRLYHQGMSRLEFLTGGEKAVIEANKETTRAFTEGLQKGTLKAEDPIVGTQLQQFRDANDTENLQQLRSAAQAQLHARGISNLPSSQQMDLLGIPNVPQPGESFPSARASAAPSAAPIRGGGAVGGSNFQEYNQRLNAGDVQSALRGSEGLRTDAYWDVNHWRTGYGSDTVTRADGSIETVTAATKITPADAERDLQRRTGLATQSAQSAVGPVWDSLSAGGKAALTSVVYNYGHLPGDITAAAGNPAALASAIAAHAGDNNGANSARRQAEAAAVTGGGAQAREPIASPYTAPQIAANPFLMSNYVQQLSKDATERHHVGSELADGVEGAFKAGIPPRAQDVAQVLQLSAEFPDDKALNEKADRIRGFLGADALSSSLPADQAVAYKNNVMAQAGGADIHTINTANAFKDQFERNAAQLQEHPMLAAVNRGWIQPPPPLDPKDPNIGAAISQRGQAAVTIGSRSGNPMQSIFDKDEVPGVKAAISNSPVDQQLSMLAPISALPDNVRDATFKQLGDDKEARVFAVAGNLVAQGNSQAARDVLAGNALLKQNPKLAPDPKDRETATFASLPTSAFGEGLRSTVSSAAEALYAKKSADAGGPQPAFNPTLWGDSINQITGGIVDYRGSKVIVPTPGMSENDFTSTVKGLSDADLSNTRLSNGQSLPADQLKPSMFGSQGYRLESHGPGQYLIFSGAEGARSYVNSAQGGPFVLDLNPKVGAKSPPSATPASAPPGGWGPLGPPGTM